MDKELLQSVLDSLLASEAYITALRQRIYSHQPQFFGNEHLKTLDALSQKEWPLREKLIEQLKEKLNA